MSKFKFISTIPILMLSSCALFNSSVTDTSFSLSESLSGVSESEFTSEESSISTFVSSEETSISSFSSLISSEKSSSSSLESSSISESSSSVDDNPLVTLDFYNINDFHGSIEENRSLSEPGLSKLASFLLNEKNKNPTGFVLTNSGDMWQGSALSNLNKGQLINEWMNYMEFDCMTLGNHEFDWGIDQIKSSMEYLNFPVISTNIINSETYNPVDWIEGTYIKEIAGVKVGFVGAIGEGQTGDIIASVSHTIEFPDPSSYVTSASQQLIRDGADIVVTLLHDETSAITRNMATYSDLFFCGHTHTSERTMAFNKPAIQGYRNGSCVGHVSLTYNKVNNNVTYNKYEVIDISNMNLNNDERTDEIIDKYLTDEVKDKINRVIGRTNSSLSQSDQSSLITRYFYYYYKDFIDEYDIYATNYNNARSRMNAGNITYKDIFKSFPFDNNMCVMKLKGKALKTITYGTFYIPNQETLQDNKDYYIFTIDYIAEYDVYYAPNLGVEIVSRFSDLLPRDIFAHYFAIEYGNA